MSLTTYTGITAAWANWMGRPGDTIISAVQDDIIALAEQRIYFGADDPYPSDRLRVRAMETKNATFSVSSEYTALPTGFLDFRRVTLNTDPVRPLELASPQHIDSTWGASQTGEPRMFSIEAGQLRIRPAPDSTYTCTIIYWAKLDTPSATTSTNWILTNAPGVYLYGGLLELALYLGDDSAATKWYTAFKSSLNGLVRSDNAGKWSGGSAQMRSDRQGM